MSIFKADGDGCHLGMFIENVLGKKMNYLIIEEIGHGRIDLWSVTIVTYEHVLVFDAGVNIFEKIWETPLAHKNTLARLNQRGIKAGGFIMEVIGDGPKRVSCQVGITRRSGFTAEAEAYFSNLPGDLKQLMIKYISKFF